MSETSAPVEAKRGPGRPPKNPEPEAKEEAHHPGHEACYVAVPNKVHDGTGAKAAPGTKIWGDPKTIDSLEARGLAFRSESEAQAAYTMWRRKEEKRQQDHIEAMAKREANRQRWRIQLEEQKIPEWRQ